MTQQGKVSVVNILSIVLTVSLALMIVWMRVSPDRVEVVKPAVKDRVLSKPEMHASVQLASISLPPPPPLQMKAEALTPQPQPVKAAAETINPPVIKISILKPSPKPTPPEPLTTEPLKPTAQVVSHKVQVSPTSPTVTPKNTLQEGRTLLRMLEFGKGPSIVIAWPQSRIQQNQLYNRFKSCYGMKVALLKGMSELYTLHSDPGSPWQPNTDKVSGFMRNPSGQISRLEQQDLDRIRIRHHLYQGTPVRLFPRKVDAVLLGSLRQIVGDSYQPGSQIQAHYSQTARGVIVHQIIIDGIEKPGQILLPPVHRC